MIKLNVNGKVHEVDVDPDTPLLWVLRDTLGLKGTKFGCGAAVCGACSVLRDGDVVRSCALPVSNAAGAELVTIEGIGEGVGAAEEQRSTGSGLHPVQEAWIEEQVPQCGYCQPGFIVATVALLHHKPNPSDEDIAQSITNLCRCGTYERVRKAIRRAAAK